jgi:hypothetical protein
MRQSIDQGNSSAVEGLKQLGQAPIGVSIEVVIDPAVMFLKYDVSSPHGRNGNDRQEIAVARCAA